jgi:DUF2075 family protein
MLLYSEFKPQFIQHVRENVIEYRIMEQFKDKLMHGVSDSERRSWANSMQYMRNVMDDPDIPDDARISIEMQIPNTGKRIDFIVSGQDATRRDQAVVVELKQWERAEATDMDAVVRTYVGGGMREVSHPSYQAWTYVALLQDFNAAVYNSDLELSPCAYLHNCSDDRVLNAPQYREHTERAPIFFKTDVGKLAAFIKRYIRYGDSDNIMYRIENGEIRPSKGLADAVRGMLTGNREFHMIDEQKVVYEQALQLASLRPDGRKRVLIVEGGPGTGKSVVAVNLLANLIGERKNALYVSKNAAPREVYASKLTGLRRKTRYTNLFKGSGAFLNAQPNEFDCLIVDEAHRLNEKSGFYGNLGEGQIREIVTAARTSVFFLDEDQRVTFQDVGSREAILKEAKAAGAEVHATKLASQFRCNGSDGYLAWLDNTLGIRETAHIRLSREDYHFEVLESPAALQARIEAENRINGRSRMVAGYCYPWVSKKEPHRDDIVFPDYGFSRKWNLTEHGSLWLVQPGSVDQVGCIHTCQGLELDYVGVIVGLDMVVQDGQLETDPFKRARSDRSIRGFKKWYKEEPQAAAKAADRIIRNTYRTLMTRGMKGCFIWCEDEALNDWFRSRLGG